MRKRLNTFALHIAALIVAVVLVFQGYSALEAESDRLMGITEVRERVQPT